MAASCTINPQVRNSKGDIVDSKLWKDLRSVLSYDKARIAYLTVKGQDFIDKYGNSPWVEYDENGEPTYESIAELRDFANIIDIESRVIAENKKLKNNETLIATRDNIDKLDDVAIDYNSSKERDKNFYATTSIFMDESGKEKVRIDIGKNGKGVSTAVREMINKRRLNRRLRAMLESKGVTVDVLSELQQKIRRITGVTDFQSSIVAASGMANTIQIAKGRQGLDALPEEFSHFVVEALHASPLIQRLYSLVLDNNLAESILGDEYEKYRAEYEKQLIDDEFVGYKKVFADDANRGVTLVEHDDLDKMLAYEAIGHLVYERILASESVISPTQITEGAERLMQRLKAQFSKELSTWDLNEIYSAINEARAVAGEFADAVMRGKLYDDVSTENIATTAQFYQLENEVEERRKLLRALIANSEKRYKILRNNEEAFDKRKEKKLIDILNKKLISQSYESGIMDWAQASLEQVKALSEQLETLTDVQDMDLNLRCQILRNIRNYERSFSVALQSIREARSNDVLEESEERDDILRQLADMTASLADRYNKYSKPIFIEVLRGYVGDSITIPYGKYKGTYTAEDLAKRASTDISWLDMMLDSAAESGDWVLKIMDAMTKKAKSEARLDTIDIKKELLRAYNKLRKAGITDTSFMYDEGGVDQNGKPLHRFIAIEQANQLSAAEQEYYKTIMRIKGKLDNYLPEGATELLNAPAIRKSYLERLSDALKNGDFGRAWESTVESIKDSFLRRADDTEFGGNNDLTDFDGNKIESLPIYFINSASELADLSTDVTSTMLMYAKMANDYHYMSGSIHTLEFMRDKMRERHISANPDESSSDMQAKATEVGYNSRIGRRTNDFFSSQVYGRYMRDEGTFGNSNIDKGKAANALNQLTALNKFALNILSGISNVATGSVMMRIESIAGQWFKFGDVVKADSIFWSQMPKFISEVGTEDKSSKLYLFDEMFNVMQDYESEVAEKDMQRSRLGHLLKGNSLYFINNAGELWMQNRTALALANNYKMKDKSGKTVSLWDALEVVTDENGVSEMKVKDGYTKEDGTEFTRKDIEKFAKKSKAINQRMHGIYNYEDRSAAQATALGRLALMFRKWIKTSMNRRYGNARYNFDLEEMEEGYWRTGWRFMQQLWNDVKAGQFNVLTRFGEMDEYERKNCLRMFTEAAHLLLIGIAFSLLKGWDDDDDEIDESFTNTWAFQQLEYQTKRLQTEVGSMTPSLRMPKEALTIIKSPAAAVTTAQGLLNTLQLINPFEIKEVYGTEVERGKYKGRKKAYKLLADSPLIPFKTTIERGLNPKEQISYYQ